MKKILIPTDFSENARNAVRYALTYYAGVPVQFYLLHASVEAGDLNRAEAYDSYGNIMEPVPLNGTSEKLYREIRFCRSLVSHSKHVFQGINEPSMLIEAVRRTVLEKEIDLIVMATRGSSESNGRIIGSNTGDVITKVKCPILVIPALASCNGVNNVALVTDHNSLYKNRVLCTLSEAVRLHPATLRILHIKTIQVQPTLGQVDNKRFLQDYVREKKHSFHFLNNKKMELGIQAFVELWEVDLIAMLAKNINLFQRLFFKPSLKSLAYHKRIPFLILHE